MSKEPKYKIILHNHLDLPLKRTHILMVDEYEHMKKDPFGMPEPADFEDGVKFTYEGLIIRIPLNSINAIVETAKDGSATQEEE